EPAPKVTHKGQGRLSIDDFGAGHSTLADLRTLQADEIKIDGRLVDDVEASEESKVILRALVDMAKCLRIDTIAEGVERPAQAEALAQLGCAHAQGYLFGEPRPALEWLSDVTFGSGAWQTNAHM
ncbi:MAG: EAL domain-containing protein, partial [Pseudomonadota bacterium]